MIYYVSLLPGHPLSTIVDVGDLPPRNSTVTTRRPSSPEESATTANYQGVPRVCECVLQKPPTGWSTSQLVKVKQ